MATTLRKRNNDGPTSINTVDDCIEVKKAHRPKYLDGLALFLVLAAVYGAVWLFVHVRVSQFPTPADPASAKLTDFVEQRARKHLDEITKVGPRVAGSENNDAAADYIVSEIAKIKSSANRVHTMEMDVQIVSGTFVLDMDSIGLGTFPSVYENQKNIVVRIGPEELTHSLLVNCHFDSVADSPGASDDAVSCAVMLEMLRALSKEGKPLPHNVIFLFNGAEENILQTGHGFITQHKWVHSIRAFVNLESAGAGGWELLFQTGPDHPWLIEAYIEAAPYPYSSIIGQEIFQGGLVPSDTDFRIFRDYGKIPGLDLAHIRNGYVYHTPNDLPSYVEPGCLQRTGENILALVRALVKSPYLTNPGERRHGTLVYFDLLGFCVIAYPQWLAVLLNWTVVTIIVVMAIWKAFHNSHSSSKWLTYQVVAMGGVILTWFVLLGVAMLMGFFMTWMKRDMSYFSHDVNVMFVFVCPAVAAALALHMWLQRSVFSSWSGEDVADLYLEANLLLWAVVVGVMTALGIMSAFCPLMFVLGPLLAHSVARLAALPLQEPRVYCGVMLVGMLVPQTYATYKGFIVLTFFIPIMGRVGTEERPDVAVAIMTMIPIVMVIPFQLGLIYLSRGMERVLKVLGVVTVVGVMALLFTPLGFPFSSTSASKQRILFVHADRQFHSPTGEVTKRHSSLWMKPLDHHGIALMEREVPQLFKGVTSGECEGAYCGRPYLYPLLARQDIRKTVDLPAPYLTVPRVHVKLVKVTQIDDNVRRLNFEMLGPTHVTIFISPVAGVHVVSWSFGHFNPVTINTIESLDDPDRDTHFVYYSYGKKPSKPWEFHIDFYTPTSLAQEAVVVEIAFAGHYLHGPQQYTDAMRHFAKQLPAWTTGSGWSATLDVYQF